MGAMPVKTERTERGTPMLARRIAAICLAGLAATLVAAEARTATQSYEETGTKRIALEGEDVLYIGNKRGDIIVLGEEGRSDIEVVFTKLVRAEDEAEAKKIASGMDVLFKRKDGELIIIAEYPEAEQVKKSILSIILQRDHRFSMDFEIRVPAEMTVKAKASSGDISVSNVSGEVELSAASGDIEAKRIGGNIGIGVSSGDIVVEDAEGSIKISSASGDINAESVKGNVEVQTSTGDIELEEIEGNLVIIASASDIIVKNVGRVTYKGSGGDAEFYGVRGGVEAGAASGDMSFYLEPEGGNDYNVRTSSGDIELRFIEKLPGGYVLRANTTNGDISVSLPIKITKIGRHFLAGIVRDGESSITLETVSGDITVTEDEE